MALSLSDVLAAPQDPELLKKHLENMGVIPIAPSQGIGTISAAPAPTAAAVKPMVPVERPQPKVISLTPLKGGSAVLSGPNTPPAAKPGEVSAPDLAMPAPSPDATPKFNIQPLQPAKLTPRQSIESGMELHGTTAGEEGKRQYQEMRPEITAAPGTSAHEEQTLAQMEYDKAHPWGGEISARPGLIGKIGHVAAKVGNIAGDILAPATMANIPGTELNKQVEERRTEKQLERERGQETTERLAGLKEQHEENIQDVNEKKLEQGDKKIEQAEKKLTETEWKDKSAHEVALRKQGLKPNPDDPNAPPVPIAPEEMSQTERDVHDLKTAQADSAWAKAELDKIKADPNSPQSQMSLARIRVMAQNAATAAGRLGLQKDKFVADYFGLSPDGNPLPGVQTTPEGKPVGPRVAGQSQKALSSFNKDYEKPANDVERSYQMYQEAQRAYNSGDSKTGAATMLALSQHLGTTFGTVKGSRMTRDLINEHRDAIGVTDRIERFVASLKRGDQLSASQMKEFGDLISNFRKLTWQTAVKEANRAQLPVNFLPHDLAVSGNATSGRTVNELKPPKEADTGMKWQHRTGPDGQIEWRQVKTQP